VKLNFQVGPDVISSYRRLAYTPWHALAEFVDNSTQAYFDHQPDLDGLFAKEEDHLVVSIVYDPDNDLIRVSDNSSGMSNDEMERALHVGQRPPNPTGRSRYGMGMKTAACWLGDEWTIRTKQFGSSEELVVVIDVPKIAAGDVALEIKSKKAASKAHHTIIEVRRLHKAFKGRTLGKIRDFLRSMYREDFRKKKLELIWNGSPLEWEELDTQLAKTLGGEPYKKPFAFKVSEKRVWGWVGILAKGSRARAGFSILHSGRVVKGWPESWRPSTLYGQLEGSNDLVNQRLVGEIHLDDFDVSHTKDDILWMGDEEDEVEESLKRECGEYREVAKALRKDADERGPSNVETQTAIQELEREITSPEFIDAISLGEALPTEAVRSVFKRVLDSQREREPRFSANVAGIAIKGYLMEDRSENDPYYLCDSSERDKIFVVVNQEHPHWRQLKGADGVLNYLRHCVYDALAEHQARHKVSTIDPDTIKLFKDRFLRIPFEMEMHGSEGGDLQQN
jgi:hypothetical protein